MRRMLPHALLLVVLSGAATPCFSQSSQWSVNKSCAAPGRLGQRWRLNFWHVFGKMDFDDNSPEEGKVRITTYLF